MTSARWISCEEDLPPIGDVVETLSPNGNVQHLKRGGQNGQLWFVPDGSMYVYYTPTAWRRLSMFG